MKYFKYLIILFLLLTLSACDIKEETTYDIFVNDDVSINYEVGEQIDYTSLFIIKDNKGMVIEITESMLDLTGVNMDEPGSYIISITYAGKHKQTIITVEPSDEIPTYTLLINESKSTTVAINDTTVDFKEFFIIKDSNQNNIKVLDSMIDDSMVNLELIGSYTLKLTYDNQTLTLVINVVDQTDPITYLVTINDGLSKEFNLGTTNVNFKEYFIITDSNQNNIEVLDSMLDLSNVALDEVGFFTVTLAYKNIEESITFEVLAPENMYASDLFISEYSEGTSYNKYIEIFNGTGESVDLSNYSLKLFNNATQPAQYDFALTGTLEDGALLVIYNGAANATIKNNGDLTNAVISFNGNDPIALFKNDVLIDIVGNLEVIVANGYDIGDVKDATKDNTIIRKANVYGPSVTWDETQWQVLGLEDYTNIKLHTMNFYQPTNPVEPVEPIERTLDLFISEYFEGNGEYKDSKYIEIYNGLGHDVDLSDYAINLYKGGEIEPEFIQPLSGILNNNDVFIVYAPYSADEIKLAGDLASEVAFFNGRHAIALTKNSEVIDLIGVIGEYPDNEEGWLVDETTGTANNTLIRHYDITGPIATWNKDEWYVCYENYIYDIGQHNVTYEDQVIDDFDHLYGLIKLLELDSKGTATSDVQVTIKGTVYMDVESETKLVYITDGKSFILLHGDRMHNHTSPNTVYEVTGNYKAHLYMPSFGVIDPENNITALRGEEPVTNITIKEVTLAEILNLKREDFVSNLNNGYLQSMLQIKSFLQLDTHNLSKWDYALTENETYTKNNTQYINNGLYFKNDVEDIEDFLMEYAVVKGFENEEVTIFGVMYEWNPNRKNWRIYVSEYLTSNFLKAN